MFCTKCGNQIFEGEKFCRKCGASISANNPEVTQNSFEQVMPEQNMPSPEPQKPKKKKTGLIVGVLVGVIALIGIVFGILFATGAVDFNDNKTETEQSEEKNTYEDEDETPTDKNDTENPVTGDDEKEDSEIPAPSTNVCEFEGVSFVIPEDFEENEMGVLSAKMFTHKEYPKYSDNITVESVEGVTMSDYNEDVIRQMYQIINTESLDIVYFEKFNMDGYSYAIAETNVTAMGVEMNARIYTFDIDGKLVMISFTSTENSPYYRFEDTVATLKVNGESINLHA